MKKLVVLIMFCVGCATTNSDTDEVPTWKKVTRGVSAFLGGMGRGLSGTKTTTCHSVQNGNQVDTTCEQ